MIWITGDTHAEFNRFSTDSFTAQKEMTKDDYVIICGDFGGVWNYFGESAEEVYWLNWLNDKNFTTLFVDGNHENFDRLNTDYPVKEWHGGRAHEIRPSVLHLMRGEVFEIEGLKFFTFGGARSHDIEAGILNPLDSDFEKRYKELRDSNAAFRVLHLSWWPQEEPSEDEMQRGLVNLEKHGNKVDYIISHECAASTFALMYHGRYKPYELNQYLEKVHQTVEFKKHFFGHHHWNKAINDKDVCLYEQITRII